MTRSKYKQPLESFDPRMIPLLLRGGLETVVLPFLGPNGKALATVFQRRLHTLRARMRDANHPQATNVSRAYVRLLWGVKAAREGLLGPNVDEETKLKWMGDVEGVLGAYISIRPMDKEFDEVLSALDLAQPKPDPIPSISGEMSVDDLLRELPDEE